MATSSTSRPPASDDPQRGSLMVGGARDEVIPGHRYDGIKEYDNPMPGWWVWTFVLCVVFAAYYVLGIYIFDTVDTYGEDLAQAQAELTDIREAYLAANPVFEADAASLAEVIANEEMILAGAVHYASYCAACHGGAGEGLIGPNLTDAYWLHGGDPVDAFRVITEGVVEKGMTPWGGVLTPEQRAETVAYIYGALQGTDPPDAKAPEGDLVERESGPPAEATD